MGAVLSSSKSPSHVHSKVVPAGSSKPCSLAVKEREPTFSAEARYEKKRSEPIYMPPQKLMQSLETLPIGEQEHMMKAAISTSWTNGWSEEDLNSRFSHLVASEALNPWWKQDSAATECLACGVQFTTFKRRHHCRRCGEIFCGSCTKNRLSLPHLNYGRTPVRVCDKCHTFRAQQLQALKTGIMVKVYSEEPGQGTKIMHMKLAFQEEDSLRLTWRSLDRVVETKSIDLTFLNEVITSVADSLFATNSPAYVKEVAHELFFALKLRDGSELYFETITPVQKRNAWVDSLRACLVQYQNKENRIKQVQRLQNKLNSSDEDSDDEYDMEDEESDGSQEGSRESTEEDTLEEDLSSLGGLPCLAVTFPEEMEGMPPVSTRRDILSRRRPSF